MNGHEFASGMVEDMAGLFFWVIGIAFFLGVAISTIVCYFLWKA